MADSLGIGFLETSAKSNNNVEQAFKTFNKLLFYYKNFFFVEWQQKL
jgi:hypothetical protein